MRLILLVEYPSHAKNVQLPSSHHSPLPSMTGGELFDHIVNETGPLPEEQVRQLSKTILEIVLYLHDQGIVHRDLKARHLTVLERI